MDFYKINFTRVQLGIKIQVLNTLITLSQLSRKLITEKINKYASINKFKSEISLGLFDDFPIIVQYSDLLDHLLLKIWNSKSYLKKKH